MAKSRSKSKRRRKPTKAQRKRRRQLLSFALTALAAIALWWFGPIEASDELPPRVSARELRVISWNLENFKGDPEHHDLERMRETLETLDPDILAVQEIKDPEALAALLPGWGIALSKGGGRGHQKLGFAWRRDRVTLVDDPIEHGELTLSGRVRPALSAYFRGHPGPQDVDDGDDAHDAGDAQGDRGGPDLWLTVVHLKAMPTGHDQRTQQWPELVEIVQELAKRDGDHVVLGDFNSTGAPGDGAASEHGELDRALAPAGLRRLDNADGCSAYYDGQRRDAWKEPSEIDLVWIRGLEEATDDETVVHSGTHCAVHHCQNFRSTKAYPEPDYSFLSDHCPVILDLRRRDDDR